MDLDDKNNASHFFNAVQNNIRMNEDELSVFDLEINNSNNFNYTDNEDEKENDDYVDRYNGVENLDNIDQCIIKACIDGNVHIIKEYLQSGHNVNDFLVSGWTLLLYASAYVQPNLIKFLLDKGADPDLHQEGYTPLMALCYSNGGSSIKRIRCLKYLIEGNADVNATNKLKETALMYACKIQDTDFILELLKYVAHINFADSEQRTALFYAVADNRYDITKILIDHGADISWVNYRGLNAYDIAITKGYDDLIPLLCIDTTEMENIDVNCISTWLDMFPTMTDSNLDSIDSVDSDVVSMLYGMGLESYKTCFRGIDLKTFLKLKEEDLERLGIDISVHRKKFIDELYKFHKEEWNKNLMQIDKSQQFTGFEAIKMLGNINKQLTVMSSSIYFSKDYLNYIEEYEAANLTLEDKEKLEFEMKNIQELAVRIKDATNKLKDLAKIINEEHSDLSLPLYIANKNKKRSHKWLIITIITIVSIYVLRMKSSKKIWNNNKTSSKNWKNIFNFSLSQIFYDKLCSISLFFSNNYQLL